MRSSRGRVAGLTLGAVLGLGFALSARRERRAARTFPPLGELVPVGGGELHILEGGHPDDPLVVFIHGADGGLQGFSETVADDIARFAHVVVVDRPGHGWSKVDPGTRCDVALNVRLIREAVRRVAGDERQMVLVGHSYGCSVALRWALRHPDDIAALVLASPAAYNTWPGAVGRAAALPHIPVVGTVITRAILPLAGPTMLRVVGRRVSFGGDPIPPSFRSYARAMYLRPKQFQTLADEYRNIARDLDVMSDDYASIPVPAWIVVGESDPLTVADQQAARLGADMPNAQVLRLEGRSHEFYWVEPQPLIDAVRDAVGAVAGEK